MIFRRFTSLILFAAVLVPSAAHAVPIIAVETIRDVLPYDGAHRDLRRTLGDTLGYNQVINDDAAIVASNAVDADFGINNPNDVTYRHNLTWLSNFAGATLVSGNLTIEANGNTDSNDIVFSDGHENGGLNNATAANGGFSTTIFFFNNLLVLDAFLSDGYLNIYIDKNRTNTAFLDSFAVTSSRFQVCYEPAAVPEPASMLLLGSSLLGLGAARRRKAANA